MKSIEGLWQFDQKLSIECLGCPPANLNYAFKIQDESIVMQILQFEMPGSDKDSYQRLACRFEKSILSYRSPNGEWTPFVKFEDGRFLCGEDGKVQAFRKIEASELDADEQDLLKERGLFEYAD